jgi:hypothetical protein
MKLMDSVVPVGTLSIYLVYPDKGKVLFFQEDNLIVKEAKKFMVTQIYAPGVMSDPITNLKVGSGGNIDPLGLYPKPEDYAQVDLDTPVLTLATTYLADLDNLKVTFLADIEQSQSNGTQFTEAGLFKASGLIFNIKNHPGINKTAEFSIHYAWTIKYL